MNLIDGKILRRLKYTELKIPMSSKEHKLIELIGTMHPGEVLSEYLDSNCWNQRELARRTGISPKTISEICRGKAVITRRTALTFEKVF